MNLDFHTLDLEPYQYSESNITGIRIFNPEDVRVQQLSAQITEEDDVFAYAEEEDTEMEAGISISLSRFVISDFICSRNDYSEIPSYNGDGSDVRCSLSLGGDISSRRKFRTFSTRILGLWGFKYLGVGADVIQLYENCLLVSGFLQDSIIKKLLFADYL